MFDDTTESPVKRSRVKSYQSPLPQGSNELMDVPADTPDMTAKRWKGKELDGPKASQMHGRLMAYYQTELSRQQENRAEMAADEDFYDNIQWDEADMAILRERGQVPLVYNVISSAINWVTGSEKRGRIDFKILPRRKESGKPAERKTELMKYLSDVNRSGFHRSRAFADAVKVGIGWLECGVQDDEEGEPIYDRYENWRNMLWDSASTEMDLSDARYIFRTKWVDLDIAESMFPDRKAALSTAATDSVRYGLSDIENGDAAMDSLEEENSNGGIGATPTHGFTRDRVRLIEGWIRKPVNVLRIRGGDFNGDVFDRENDVHIEELKSGRANVRQKVMMRMHVAIFTTNALLFYDVSPYRHNGFPFTPIWGYKRGRDGMPYGMIRGMKDIQQDINKRASKALAILSSNKVIMEEGAVDDMDAFMEEVGRPDGILVVKPNKRLDLAVDRELGAAHMQLMSQSIQMLQTQSGVTDELMGKRTNATSGVAIQARQDQGSMATALFFDNLRFSNQCQGEKQLSLMEQFMTEEKQFRITNQRGKPTYITINDGLPENDIVRTKADFVISEQEWRASVRQAQTNELMELLMKMAPAAPQLALVMLDLIVDDMDIPSREELVKRIRQVSGMRDPDAEELTPEEQQAMQKAAEQEALQQRANEARIAKDEADAVLKQANASKAQASVTLTQAQTTAANVNAQNVAIDAAGKIAMAPGIAVIADTITNESGFISRTENESNMAQAARSEAAELNEAAQAQRDAEAQAVAQAQQQQAQQAPQGQPGIGAMPQPPMQ